MSRLLPTILTEALVESSAVAWDMTFPQSTGKCKKHPHSRDRGRLASWLADTRNVPRYAGKYAVFALAILGVFQLWAAKGDGPMPVFATLPSSAGLDPHCVSSSFCVMGRTSDGDRWTGLAPALEILRHSNPVVAQWAEDLHDDGRVDFTDRSKVPGDRVNYLAKFDHFQRELQISPGLYAECDGVVATILCHEYRHSRQGVPKILSHALSFLFMEGGDPSIVENDAVIYEQEARCAIFGESNEALDALNAQFASR